MRSVRFWFLLGLSLCFILKGNIAANAAPETPLPPVQEVYLASERPIGDGDVDRIVVSFQPGVVPPGKDPTAPLPAVILIGPLSEKPTSPLFRESARLAARHGISTASLTLPYHGKRWPRGNGKRIVPANYFLSDNPIRSAAAFAQSAADVSTVASWLERQPGVDKKRLGIVGISLGAVITHLVMGQDPRLWAGVAFLGGGNLPDISRHGLLSRAERLFHPSQRAPSGMTASDMVRILRPVDPLTYADQNRPRYVFMIQGARDNVIPPKDATELWEALGRPPISWIDTNHFALTLALHSGIAAAIDYLDFAWSRLDEKGLDDAPFKPPTIPAPTIKLGLIGQARGPNSLGITPSLTYQIAALGKRSDHISLFHADIGITGRGPFVGAGITLSPYIDLGVAVRVSRTLSPPRPYLGLHVAF